MRMRLFCCLAFSLLFGLASFGQRQPLQQLLVTTPPVRFTLSRAFALTAHNGSTHPLTLFHDQALDPLTPAAPRLRTRPVRVFRPASQAAYRNARLRSMVYGQSENVPWEKDVVLGPDVTDRGTLLELAKMTSNAYTTPSGSDWYDLGNRWNKSEPFGWEHHANGFRGHVFVSSDDPPTVVVAIKGTTPAFPSGPTWENDKLNDNMLFSCCCARVDWKWRPVCDCYSGGWKCDQGCLSAALKEESLYYSIGINLYNNITQLYPDANIWIVGHSLGGALSSLLGLSFGVPVVSFQAPGERLASTRLHLPLPPFDDHITHVYHNADPIATGQCNGVSLCTTFGYAFDTKCHNGKAIMYDVRSRGWGLSLRSHEISLVIDKLLDRDWEILKAVPDAVRETDCEDCPRWDFEG